MGKDLDEEAKGAQYDNIVATLIGNDYVTVFGKEDVSPASVYATVPVMAFLSYVCGLLSNSPEPNLYLVFQTAVIVLLSITFVVFAKILNSVLPQVDVVPRRLSLLFFSHFMITLIAFFLASLIWGDRYPGYESVVDTAQIYCFVAFILIVLFSIARLRHENSIAAYFKEYSLTAILTNLAKISLVAIVVNLLNFKIFLEVVVRTNDGLVRKMFESGARFLDSI
ncbi:hypothetical protein [Roseibium sediminicola]|uniref:Uncharacterized protein n=1 Tax=Roseibium sediminicola TaxID=2933272 RepID=A0ABT0GXY0_9HYPH|nr:hypothetical protein [Roseibium sp. CAU 1639]MCK7613675.1 hypothetical protein [Roseibium sp. CAU 1639]